MIFQIYYDPESRSELDHRCIPVDNSEPLRQEEYEYAVMRRLYAESHFINADLFGVFSWKFHFKFGCAPSRILDIVTNVGNIDIVICNPYPQSSCFLNVWQQGESCHPGILSVARKLFVCAGLDAAMLDLRMGYGCECYCNYWLANRKFLDLYFSFSERIYWVIYNDAELSSLVFNGVRHSVIRAPWFPFIFERLFSTFLAAFRSSFNVLVIDSPLAIDGGST